METNIGMSCEVIKPSVTRLNNQLADQFVLFAKTTDYLCNIKGTASGAYRQFLKEINKHLVVSIDETAERIRSLDGRPLGSLRGFYDHTRIKESCDHKELPDALGMLKLLVCDFETVIREIRTDLADLESKTPSDEGTLNFMQAQIESFEKTAWMLRAHLE